MNYLFQSNEKTMTISLLLQTFYKELNLHCIISKLFTY